MNFAFNSGSESKLGETRRAPSPQSARTIAERYSDSMKTARTTGKASRGHAANLHSHPHSQRGRAATEGIFHHGVTESRRHGERLEPRNTRNTRNRNSGSKRETGAFEMIVDASSDFPCWIS